jgi:hypothetical protein
MAPKPDRPTEDQIEAARPKVIDAVLDKASRYAKNPQEGYASGCYPYQKGRIGLRQLETGEIPFPGRSDQLAWVYGVASQDVPLAYYTWQVVEEEDGTFELVLTAREVLKDKREHTRRVIDDRNSKGIATD